MAEFEAQLTSALSSEALAGPIEIWFQDEARIGQKGMTTRVWANGKQRPRIVRDHRYGYVLSVRRHLRRARRRHRPRGGQGEHGVDERASWRRSARPWRRVRTA